MSTVKLKANQDYVATDSSPITMTNGDNVVINNGALSPIIHMGAGTETVFDNDANANSNVTVYGGSGKDTVSAVGFNASFYPKLTFIGGTGSSVVKGVVIGFGGSGNDQMYGAFNSHLYEGIGETDFGLAGNRSSVTVETFTHGKDHLIFSNVMSVAQEHTMLDHATSANGYVQLNLNYAGGIGTMTVHTDSLTFADLKQV